MENYTNVIDKTFLKSDANALHTGLKTISMGLVSLKALTNVLKEDSLMSRYLDDQVDGYKTLQCEFEDALTSIGEKPDKTNAFESSMVSASVNVKTMVDNSDSHVADMMIKGSNMGVIEITKLRNEEEGRLSDACYSLLSKLLNTLDLFVEDMKQFL